MTTPRGPSEYLATLAVDAANDAPPLKPIRRHLTEQEIAAVDAWMGCNMIRSDPETRAAFRRALIEKPDFRAAVLG
jgi:hypothetical protein